MAIRQLASEDEMEKFQQYLFEMDDVLREFLNEVAAQAGVALDFTTESLDRLEPAIDILLSRPGAEVDTVKNRAARYLGEAFRRHIGGTWELCLKDPKYMYFKLPVIAGYADMPIEFSPVSVVGNYIVRRKRGLLRGAVAASEQWKARR
jgi:hypothetical protein